jgi:hypothetical protein
VSVWLPGELMLYLIIIKKLNIMNAQVIMMLIAMVSIIRFFKGFKNRKDGFNVETEMIDFITQLVIVFVVYGVVYFGLSFFA